jgi:uncharacterized cupin superfamily protein
VPTPAVVRFDAAASLESFPDFPETEISSGARDNRGHLWLDDPEAGLEAGVWESEPNLGRWMEWPVHEFMIIVEGEVVMIEEDRETVIGPGESFVIPKGRRCVWNQSRYAKKFFMIFDDKSPASADGSSPILKVDPDVGLRQYFEDASGRLTVAMRELTDSRREPSLSHELIHVIEGHLDVTDAGGTQSFAAGDTFFVPFGAMTSWKSAGAVRALCCTFTPRSRS